MTKRRRTYTREFKIEAVRWIGDGWRAGRGLSELRAVHLTGNAGRARIERDAAF
jgi:hypothetical protein